jgi:hypothetical protein
METVLVKQAGPAWHATSPVPKDDMEKTVCFFVPARMEPPAITWQGDASVHRVSKASTVKTNAGEFHDQEDNGEKEYY